MIGQAPEERPNEGQTCQHSSQCRPGTGCHSGSRRMWRAALGTAAICLFARGPQRSATSGAPPWAIRPSASRAGIASASASGGARRLGRVGRPCRSIGPPKHAACATVPGEGGMQIPPPSSTYSRAGTASPSSSLCAACHRTSWMRRRAMARTAALVTRPAPSAALGAGVPVRPTQFQGPLPSVEAQEVVGQHCCVSVETGSGRRAQGAKGGFTDKIGRTWPRRAQTSTRMDITRASRCNAARWLPNFARIRVL